MVNYRAPTNIRFPPDLHADIKKLSEERNVSFTQIVIEACYQYIDGVVPGLCSSCHTQNNPDSQYCQKCGSSLSPGIPDSSMQKQIEELQEQIAKLKEDKYKLLERHVEELLKKRGLI